jgi:hypothetical protein
MTSLAGERVAELQTENSNLKQMNNVLLGELRRLQEARSLV